jgi:hypothetical protein
MAKILDGVDSPADLKKIAEKDLPVLADEIRDLILETVSRTGGHLSSNLGAVELSLAPQGQDPLGRRPSVLHPQDPHRAQKQVFGAPLLRRAPGISLPRRKRA